jgi:hypothetical protein
MNVSDLTPEELAKLHDTLLQHPGSCSVLLHLVTPDEKETIMELPSRFSVKPGSSLLEAMEKTFGRRISAAPLLL